MRLARLNPREALIALAIVAIPFGFFWDFLLLQKVFYYFDIEIHWIPIHQFVRTALAEGESILWNPYVMLGFPQHAESQAGNFYPPNFLLHLLPRQEYAMALSIYGHLTMAFWATWRLGRVIGLEALPALLAALCFAFCGFMFAQISNYNILLVASYLPLKLLLITWYFQRNNPKYLLYFTLLLGIELLICHANLTFITTFGAGVYFLALALTLRDKKSAVRDLGCFAACALLAALLAALQILPTYELMNQSWRAGGLDYDGITGFSLSFTQYLTSFFPMMYGVPSIGYSGADYFDELYFYVGIPGIVLGFFGALHLLQRRDNRYLAAASLVGLTGLFLSLGSNNPIDIFRLLVHVPGFNFFRCPGRWSVLLTLGIALLAGYGLQVLIESLKEGKRWRPLLLMIGIGVAVPLVIYGMSLFEPVDHETVLHKITHPLDADLGHLGTDEQFMYGVLTRISPLVYLLCMMLALAAIVAASACRLPAKYCALAILSLSFLDLLFVLRPLHPRAEPDFFSFKPEYIEYLQQNAGVYRAISSYQVPNMQSVHHSMGAYYGIQSPKGYASIKLKNYIAIEGLIEEHRPDILDYLGVKYEIVQKKEEDGQELMEREGAFPRAFLLDKYAVSGNDEGALETFLNLNPANRKSHAIISKATAAMLGLAPIADITEGGSAEPEVRAVELASYHHASVEMQAVTEQPSFLILTDIHYPGWQAKVDGREVPIVPVQGVFRGIYLDRPGPFKIEMVYEPLSFKIGAACSMLGMILLAGAGFWFSRRWSPAHARE